MNLGGRGIAYMYAVNRSREQAQSGVAYMLCYGSNMAIQKHSLTAAKVAEVSRGINGDTLLTKDQLAEKLDLTRRGVECLVANRRIPVIRISARCVRFSWPKVQAALDKLTVNEVAA
jgi:hypothetical protein